MSISDDESAALKEAEQKQDIQKVWNGKKPTLFGIKGYYVIVKERHSYGIKFRVINEYIRKYR